MARQKGSTSSVVIPLSKLVAKLKPDSIVKVSKGWLEAVQEANDIDFELEVETPETEAEAPAPAEAAAPASKPTFVVE